MSRLRREKREKGSDTLPGAFKVLKMSYNSSKMCPNSWLCPKICSNSVEVLSVEIMSNLIECRSNIHILGVEVTSVLSKKCHSVDFLYRMDLECLCISLIHIFMWGKDCMLWNGKEMVMKQNFQFLHVRALRDETFGTIEIKCTIG